MDKSCSLCNTQKVLCQVPKIDLDLWPHEPKSVGFFIIIDNLNVKYQSDWVKTEACRNTYRQTAQDSLELWPRDPKSIGFFLKSQTTNMWSSEVIGQQKL